MSDKVIGGRSFTDENCKKCGKKWTRYRLGSFDWKYEDCQECKFKESDLNTYLENNMKPTNFKDKKLKVKINKSGTVASVDRGESRKANDELFQHLMELGDKKPTNFESEMRKAAEAHNNMNPCGLKTGVRQFISFENGALWAKDFILQSDEMQNVIKHMEVAAGMDSSFKECLAAFSNKFGGGG